jgi:hypothetical protein
MLGIGRTLNKPFEIHRTSRVADLGGVNLLQTKNVRLDPFKLRTEYGRPLFKGCAMPAPVAETFKIEGGDAHGDFGPV